jgi:hypothetical protein
MNQRERLLAIAVGGLLLALAVSWGFGKYRSALQARRSALAAEQNRQQQITEQLLQGEYANRYMGEYLIRSLPANPERAKSAYQQWLLATIDAHQISSATVSANSSRMIGDLYQRLEFRFNGQGRFADFIELLHAFYAKDYLHRIRSFSLSPTKDGDFKIEMSIDAIALLAAPADATPRSAPSWQVAADVTAYRDEILNRNMFAPPNQPPTYQGDPVVEAIVGRATPTPLRFADPDGDSLEFAFMQPPPEFVRLDEQTGALRVDSDETQEFEIQVRATDAGYPRKSIEQTLTVKIVDPPPPPPPPKPKPDFDDASQTSLTALLQVGDEWTAWMNVRTRGQTLKLRVGDQFEIGSLQGSVIELTAKYALLEVNGRRFQYRQGMSLADAFRDAAEE